MAVQAKDGSTHHSAGRASLHDSMSAGAEKKQNVAPMKKPGGEKKIAPSHPAPSPHSIQEHVSQHGPAHKMTHHHDRHGTGKHHVTTHHGDTEEAMHHSEHDTAEAAHAHMGVAMGATETPEQEAAETPEQQMGENEGAEQHMGKIPGLA